VNREIAPAARTYPDGIIAFAIDPATGRLREPGRANAWLPASYSAYDPKRRRLFVLNQTRKDRPSSVGSFIAGDDGKLTLINEQSTDGIEACHLTVDASGSCIVSAHFSSASYAVHKVGVEGALQPPSQVYRVSGSGPHARQNVPHPHMAQVSPDGRWIVTADLGNDEIACLSLNVERGVLAPHQVPAAKVQPGGGARHFVFHSSGRVFVCNELDSSVTTMSYDAERGSLAYVEHTSTLMDGRRSDDAACGAIRLSPDERFLYVANRKRQTIAVFGVETARLRPLAEADCRGISARDMFVTESVIYVAFAGDDRCCVFARDGRSGEVGALLQTVFVPAPMFVLPISS